MATLTFQTLRFSDHKDELHVTFMKYYAFILSHDALAKIGKWSAAENAITFVDVPEKRLKHKFYVLLEEGFKNLVSNRPSPDCSY